MRDNKRGEHTTKYRSELLEPAERKEIENPHLPLE